MSHYKAYPKYIDSGVDWLGNVPGTWGRTKLAYLADYINGAAFKPDDWGGDGLPIIRIAQLTGSDFDNFYRGTLKERLRVRDGDLLFSWSATIDSFIWSRGPAWLNQHIFRVIPTDEADKHYLFFLIKAVAPKLAEFDAHGSTMRHIKKESLKETVFVPSVGEQRAIAQMLEVEAARIDALIDKKARFIELLKEKRQALITHAATKGLDPKVKMKDSGAKWLGQVPEHWTVLAAKRLFRERDERSVHGDEEMMTVSHLTGVTPRSEKNVNMFEAETTEGYKICRPGDLAINTLWAWMGAMGTARQLGIVSPAYNIYTPNERLDPEFVDLLVRMPPFAKEVTRFSKGIRESRLRLYPEGFFEVQFAVPPIPEQRFIVGRVREKAAQIESLAAKTQRSIDLLKERRSALITAAVTGQIDLREVA